MIKNEPPPIPQLWKFCTEFFLIKLFISVFIVLEKLEIRKFMNNHDFCQQSLYFHCILVTEDLPPLHRAVVIIASTAFPPRWRISRPRLEHIDESAATAAFLY